MNGTASDNSAAGAGRKLLHARQARERARAHLHDTLERIEQRMSPEGLADDAGRVIHAKLAKVGRRSVATARERPIALAAGASAIIAALAHKPIWQGAKRLFDRFGPAATH